VLGISPTVRFGSKVAFVEKREFGGLYADADSGVDVGRMSAKRFQLRDCFARTDVKRDQRIAAERDQLSVRYVERGRVGVYRSLPARKSDRRLTKALRNGGKPSLAQ